MFSDFYPRNNNIYIGIWKTTLLEIEPIVIVEKDKVEKFI